jgi:hypothetical protein
MSQTSEESKNQMVVKSDYIWPLSGSAMADNMNTSFGPRIRNDRWHFHEGIDLPASKGTKVYAMRSGQIYLAGPRDDKFNSRHVVIKVKPDATNTRSLYIVYLHLDKISKNIRPCIKVKRGQYIGNVGSDGATYPHLHIEIRKGKLRRGSSIHPLNYLPYDNNANFKIPIADKFQKCGPNTIKARLFLTADDKNEGDLKKVEVYLLEKDSVIGSPKIVDFDNGLTIHKNDANNDGLIYNNQGIGVEGYQKSNMVRQCFRDLHYGILIRDIPKSCTSLKAKLMDVSGNIITSPKIPILSQKSAINQILDFEDGSMPPKHWKIVTSSIRVDNSHPTRKRKRTQVSNESIAAFRSNHGMLSKVSQVSKSGSHAAIEYELPRNECIELLVESMFNPAELKLNEGNSIYPLYFLNDENVLSFAAGIYKKRNNNIFQTRLIAKNPNRTIKHSVNNQNTTNRVNLREWRAWRLELRRIDTRETTAILSLGCEDNCPPVEVAHISFDSRTYKPSKLRVGIGFCPSNARGTIFADNIRLTGCM